MKLPKSVVVRVHLWLIKDIYDKEMELNDITYEIRGAVFKVNKILGSGFLEKVYENALQIELKSRGLKAASQVPLKVTYKGEIVGDYFAEYCHC